MTITLFIVAILLALWLCLRAASKALLPSLRLAVDRARQNEATTQVTAQFTAQVTAEDYETYLNAMEAAFKTARIPCFPKTPRKPRQTKLKTPPQARPSEPLNVTAANVASKAKPKNRPQVENKSDMQPLSADSTNLDSQVVPNHQPSRIPNSQINLPLIQSRPPAAAWFSRLLAPIHGAVRQFYTLVKRVVLIPHRMGSWIFRAEAPANLPQEPSQCRTA